MKGLLAAAALLIAFGSKATAQQPFGPVAVSNAVNGVPVTVSATWWLKLRPAGDDLVADVRMLADLIDVQRKFPDIVATFTPPANPCADRHGTVSAVTALERVSLAPTGDQFILSVRGHTDSWSCIARKGTLALRWRKRKIASFKIKLPAIETSRPMTMRKKGSQPFRAELPIYLVSTHEGALVLETGAPAIVLLGHNRAIGVAGLRIAEMQIRRLAHAALTRAIEPAKLMHALPAKLRDLKLAIVSTRFRGLGGHVIAEINMHGQVPDGAGTPLLQSTAARP